MKLVFIILNLLRRFTNKLWATRNSKKPVIAKPTLSAKKVLYAIFFSGEGVAMQGSVIKGKSVTGKYYKGVVLKKLKRKNTIRNGAQSRDNDPAHTFAIVTFFFFFFC